MGRIKVHYHSDSQTYAGCEQMMTTFLTSPIMDRECQISFSCRYTEEYEKGFKEWTDEAGGLLPQHRLYSIDFPVTQFYKHRILRGLSQYLFLPAMIKYLRGEIFQPTKPQIVHINNGGYPGAMSCNAAAIAGGQSGAKVVYFANGITPRSRTRELFDGRFLDWQVRNCTDVLLTGSYDNLIKMQEIWEADSAAYAPIFMKMSNTLHARKSERERKQVRTALGIDDSTILLGCIAVFEARKGIKVLVEAYKALYAKFGGRRIDLLLVGERGDSKRVLDEVDFLAAQYPINVHVSYNTISNHNFIKAMDIFVYHPLEQEDFGNNILLALKLGIPIVASAVSGNKEMVVDDHNGYLVDPGDVEGVVLCTGTLINDDRMRAYFGENGKKMYQDKYSNEVVLGDYVKLYRGLLE
jgi:glycosyltransferase involved in cell wall biosynthesis